MAAVPEWWCCLSETENICLKSIAPLVAASLVTPVPRALFDLFWVGAGRSIPARREAFLQIFGLNIVTIDEEGVPLEVLEPEDLLVWVEFALWSLLPVQGCEEGCKHVRFP